MNTTRKADTETEEKHIIQSLQPGNSHKVIFSPMALLWRVRRVLMLTIKTLLKSSEPLILPFLSIFPESALMIQLKAGSSQMMSGLWMMYSWFAKKRTKENISGWIVLWEHHLNHGTVLNFSERITAPPPPPPPSSIGQSSSPWLSPDTRTAVHLHLFAPQQLLPVTLELLIMGLLILSSPDWEIHHINHPQLNGIRKLRNPTLAKKQKSPGR